jgi:hypothetical protein
VKFISEISYSRAFLCLEAFDYLSIGTGNHWDKAEIFAFKSQYKARVRALASVLQHRTGSPSQSSLINKTSTLEKKQNHLCMQVT